jgi:protein CpxP
MTTKTKPNPNLGVARGFKRVVGGLLLAVSAGVAVTAWAAAPGGPGPMGHGGPGHGWFAGSPERIDRGVDRILGSVNATEAQRTQVKQIVRAAAADLKTQRDAGRSLREQSAKLFTAPTVDANAVESLRQQMLAQHDQSSRRISQAMLEVSRVLTPEQRVQLAEKMKRWGERAGRDGAHRDGGPRGEGPGGRGPAAAPQK